MAQGPDRSPPRPGDTGSSPRRVGRRTSLGERVPSNVLVEGLRGVGTVVMVAAVVVIAGWIAALVVSLLF